MSSRVYVVMVNWNGWRDTIECLESVFRIDYPDYKVIVCDNGSGDGSIGHIKEWAEGRQAVNVPDGHPLRHLSHPPVAKPVAWREIDRAAAEAGGHGDCDSAPLLLVRNGGNLGFAGGVNVGLRYVLARDDFEYVWLLNNDTVVSRDALTRMVDRMKGDPGAGICGSTLPFYSDPDMLWARGGAAYNRWLASASCIGLLQPASSPFRTEDVESDMDYVAGASMLVSSRFLREVGLMSEDYFLYFEELDWAERARGRFRLAYAPGSVVYHKVGASTKTLGGIEGSGSAANLMNLESALIFTRKFHPSSLPTVWLTVAAARAVIRWRSRCR